MSSTSPIALGLKIARSQVVLNERSKFCVFSRRSHFLYRCFTSFAPPSCSLNGQISIRAGKWAEKESLDRYVEDRIPNLSAYFKHLPRSLEERKLAAGIQERFLSQQGYNYLSSLPYRLHFKNPHKTYENSGSGFFYERDLAFYMKHGFIGPIRLDSISRLTLQAIHQRFTDMLKGLTPDQSRLKILRQEWHDVDILNLVTHPEIVAKVSSLLGDNIKMRFTSMHEVSPGLGSFSHMTNRHIPDFYAHSDMNLGTAVISRNDTEKPFCDRDAVSVWISISGTNEDNAPLFVFPGTHQWDIMTPLTYLEHTKNDPVALAHTCHLLATKGFANQLNANHKLFYDYLRTSHYQSALKTIRRTEMYMDPGDCLFFTTHLLHGSGINQTSVSRLGISIRFSSAMNIENDENLSIVRRLFSKEERTRLGVLDEDDRVPVMQVLGVKHHPRSNPINIGQLRQILTERALKKEGPS